MWCDMRLQEELGKKETVRNPSYISRKTRSLAWSSHVVYRLPNFSVLHVRCVAKNNLSCTQSWTVQKKGAEMSTPRLWVLWCEHRNGIPRQENLDKCQRPGQLLRYTLDWDMGSRRDKSSAGLRIEGGRRLESNGQTSHWQSACSAWWNLGPVNYLLTAAEHWIPPDTREALKLMYRYVFVRVCFFVCVCVCPCVCLFVCACQHWSWGFVRCV